MRNSYSQFAETLSDSNVWMQRKVSSMLERDGKTLPAECLNSRDPLYMLLKSFYREPSVIWKLGGDGSAIRLYSHLNKRVDLFDLSFYDDPDFSPSVRYLMEHSIDEIFAGKNPDMVPDSISIIQDGGGIVEINFKCSDKLKAAGVDESYFLNRDLYEAVFGVKIVGRDEKYLIGYTMGDNQEPFVKSYSADGTTCEAKFSFKKD